MSVIHRGSSCARSTVVSSFILSCFALLVLISSAEAAKYKKTDGTWVDPIRFTPRDGNGHHPYSGADLEPWATVPGADLHRAWLDHVDLSHADLSGANMNFAWLQNASLQSANLQHAEMSIAVLIHADFSGANLTHSSMLASLLHDAIFHGAIGHPATLSSSQLTLTDTEEVMIAGADITGADFSGADLSGADFNHENDLLDVIGWSAATWTGASFHYLAEPDWPNGMVHTDHGITVRTPEPATLLLALVGLALLPRRRRR